MYGDQKYSDFIEILRIVVVVVRVTMSLLVTIESSGSLSAVNKN